MVILKKLSLLASVALLGLALTPAAHALTAGGATIHNTATLTFTGGTATASVNVTVNTIASLPTITVDKVANGVDVYAGNDVVYTYTIVNNANGSDTFNLTANSTDTSVSADTLTLSNNANFRWLYCQ